MQSGRRSEPHGGAGPYAIGCETRVHDDPRSTLVASGEDEYPVMVRLTITNDDILGNTFASQFDFIEQGRWVLCRFENVRRGVAALAIK
jgi:hypothetical protein